MRSIAIPLPKLFSWPLMLAHIGRSDRELLQQVVKEQVYRAILLEGQWHLVRVWAEGNVLHTDSLLSDLSPDQAKALQAWIRIWLGLEQDLEGFYALAASDSLLKPLLEPLSGFRVGGIPDLFEALGWTVLGQQINLAFAYTLKARLVQTYGTELSDPQSGITCWGWPDPEGIAALDPEVLRPLSISRAKSRALVACAEAIASGQLSRAQLVELQDAGAQEAALIKLKGIGPWSAQYVMLRCLQQPQAFPAGDAGLQNNVKRLLGLEAKPDAKTLREMATQWQPFQGLAAGYIWQAPA